MFLFQYTVCASFPLCGVHFCMSGINVTMHGPSFFFSMIPLIRGCVSTARSEFRRLNKMNLLPCSGSVRLYLGTAVLYNKCQHQHANMLMFRGIMFTILVQHLVIITKYKVQLRPTVSVFNQKTKFSVKHKKANPIGTRGKVRNHQSQ